MSKRTYILVDSLNMFFRAKHVGGGRDIDMRVGMAMHFMFNSISNCWREFNGSHVVMFEGRSWQDFMPETNLKVTMDKRSTKNKKMTNCFLKHMMIW